MMSVKNVSNQIETDQQLDPSRSHPEESIRDESREQQLLQSSSMNKMAVETTRIETIGKLPVDTGWAWVVVTGSCIIQLIGVGIGKSFGIMFVEFIEKFQSDAGKASWILSLNVLLCMMLGPLTTSLGMKVTNRVILVIGGALFCLGFAMSAYVKTMEALYLTYGVTVGVAFSCIYAPSIIVVAEYFEKRRSLANGIAVAGSGLGNLVIPILTQHLLDKWSVSGTLLLLGGLGLNICVAAMLIRPASFYVKRKLVKVKNSSQDENTVAGSIHSDTLLETEFSKDESAMERLDDKMLIPKNLHLRSAYYASSGNLSHGSVQSLADSIQNDISNHNPIASSKHGQPRTNVESTTDMLPPTESRTCWKKFQDTCKKIWYLPHDANGEQRPIFDFSLIWNPHFLVFFFSAFFSSMGYINVIMLIPSLAKDMGFQKWEAAKLVSIVGGTDLAGRLVIGWFADLNLVKIRYTVIVSMAAAGFSVIFMPFWAVVWIQGLLGALFGLFGGSYIALTPVMLVEAMGPEKLPNTFGLTMVAMGISCMVSILLFGYLRVIFGSWDISFYLAGIALILGALCLILEPVGWRCHERRKKQARENDIIAETQVIV